MAAHELRGMQGLGRSLSGCQMRSPLLFAALITAVIGGCTPMRWERAGMGPDEAGHESTQCRQMAWVEAQNQSFFFGRSAWSPFARDRHGRLYATPFSGFHERQIMEMQLADFCMRSKGFVLVPVR